MDCIATRTASATRSMPYFEAFSLFPVCVFLFFSCLVTGAIEEGLLNKQQDNKTDDHTFVLESTKNRVIALSESELRSIYSDCERSDCFAGDKTTFGRKVLTCPRECLFFGKCARYNRNKTKAPM